MAKFNGCIASGNRKGGFYTNNAQSEFLNCTAEDSDGLGFVDDSGGEREVAAKPSRGKRISRFLGQVSVNALGSAIGGALGS